MKCLKCKSEIENGLKCCNCEEYTCQKCEDFYCLAYKSCDNCMQKPSPNTKQQIATVERDLELHPPKLETMSIFYDKDGYVKYITDPRLVEINKLKKQL